MLKEFQIDADAVNYIRQELREGDTFAEYLLDLPLENGRVMSYLPAPVHPVTPKDFRQSIYIATGIKTAGEATSKLQRFVASYLTFDGNRYAIFETLGRVGDKWLSATNLSYFVHESRIYSFLTPAEANEQRILQVLKRARRYPFVCGLTRLPEDDQRVQTLQEIQSNTLRALAANTQHIVVGAFDDEAFLIWTKAE